MSLDIGQVIHNRYNISEVLASGGMGTVYRARDESLGIEVALKEFLPGKISIEHQRRNTALIAGLNHPAIPRVTDSFVTESGSQVLVMDYIPGDDLRSIIEKKGPLPTGKAINIISAIGSALHFLHKQNPPVIHQDVKPGNIRITPDGKAVLVDFDLATELIDSPFGKTTNDQGLTPGFAAPEQYNRMASPASDQYGLAATLFYLLTGVVLPDGISRASGNSDLPEQFVSRISIDLQTCLKKHCKSTRMTVIPMCNPSLMRFWPLRVPILVWHRPHLYEILYPYLVRRIMSELLSDSGLLQYWGC
jgi:serine/threonine protein kinase